MSSPRDFLPLFPAALSLALFAGCSGTSSGTPTGDDSIALAEDGTDANDIESQSSALTAAFTLGTGDFQHPAASVQAAANVAGFFTPTSCVTTQTDLPNLTVTYTLASCNGPWGLANITGSVVVVYSSVDGGLALDVTGTHVEFDGKRPNHGSADLHATATVTANGSAREMTWNATLTGKTARGNAFTRTSNWDTKWRVGESCIALDGSAEGNVTARKLKTSVDGYQRCLGSCPVAGGKITILDEGSNHQVSLAYNGGNDATFTDVNGQETAITLACGL